MGERFMTGTLRPGRRAVRLIARLAWMGPAVFLLLLPVGPAAAQAGAAQPPGQSRVVQPAGVVRVGSLPPPRPGPQAPQAQKRRVPDAALIRSKKDEAQAHDGGPPAGPGALAPSAALKLAGGAGFAGVAYADQPVG